MSSTRSGQQGSSNQKRSNCSSAAANRCPMRGLGRAWQSTMMSMLVADRVSHRGDAALGVTDRREPLERHRRRHRHRLERGEALLDHAGGELAEPLRLAALVEVLHLALAEMAVEANVVAHRARPRACDTERRAPCRGCPRARCRCRSSPCRARCRCRARSAGGTSSATGARSASGPRRRSARPDPRRRRRSPGCATRASPRPSRRGRPRR